MNVKKILKSKTSFNKKDYKINYKDCSCEYFNNLKTLEEVFDKLNIYQSNNSLYKERLNKLIYDSFNTKLTIKNIDSLHEYYCNKLWEEYRKENANYFDNVFGKICSEIRNSDSIESLFDNSELLYFMKDTLGKNYNILYKAIVEYFNIYHSNDNNKIEKLLPSKDIISKMSSLYISKSKENYKKLNKGVYNIKRYFSLNENNSLVKKRLEYLQRKQLFQDYYYSNDKNVLDFINHLELKYSNDLNIESISDMIKYFIICECNKYHEICDMPKDYNEYIRYLNANKLIKRLKLGYIKYSDNELNNYRDIISIDENNNYFYSGRTFNNLEIEKYKEYYKNERLFEKIKKDIINEAYKIDLNNNYDNKIIMQVIRELPINDEYFIFNNDYALKEFSFDKIINILKQLKSGFSSKNILSDECYEVLYNLFVNYSLIWIMLINSTHFLNIINNVDTINLIKNIDRVTDFISNKNDLSFTKLMEINKVISVSDSKTIAILGKEIIEKLCSNKRYTNNNEKEIVQIAKDLYCQMIKKNERTVPYINGNYNGYNYFMYDSQDETLLISGINTDSCFRVNSINNDFMHYCALDKNGFIIKIVNEEGDFIARASGFRNGNCVFINQLRTIYDIAGLSCDNKFDNEKNEIINTFKKACSDIVSISQNNLDEEIKIDYVFVTKSYILDKEISNVSSEVCSYIGTTPMDMASLDWMKFVDNTKNLKEVDDIIPFTTDYGEYPLICVASSHDINNLKKEDIIKCDVSPLYNRMRNKIIVSKNVSEDLLKKINKIKALKMDYSKKKFFPQKNVDNYLLFIGDNWFIIFDGINIVDSCLLSFDLDAKKEYDACMKVIYEMKTYDDDEYVKILRLIK